MNLREFFKGNINMDSHLITMLPSLVPVKVAIVGDESENTGAES